MLVTGIREYATFEVMRGLADQLSRKRFAFVLAFSLRGLEGA